MDKNQFLERFTAYNEQIEAAVSSQNFVKVVDIDTARRTMLREYAENSAPEHDKEFFEVLEQCAEDNARAITKLNAEINTLRQASVNKVNGLKGYRHF